MAGLKTSIPRVAHDLFSDTKPLTEEELEASRARQMKQQREHLIAWVRDGLFVEALKDNELARAICMTAGPLACRNADLAKILKKGMKAGPRWDKSALYVLWIDYDYFLQECEGDEGCARRRLIKKLSRRGEKPISDRRLQNLLTQAAKIPLCELPDFVRRTAKNRLDRGRKTMRRGSW